VNGLHLTLSGIGGHQRANEELRETGNGDTRKLGGNLSTRHNWEQGTYRSRAPFK
jgi:hypothetical protein